ncbi:uncharacterized protein LOC118439203 [Folsomia candida]|uniref:uncharacterized protein LOC118439203 n=1 Tax=Folsomia candida TaxID=158441 RepID=UPI001604F2B6|nr:uncharacterized protein LOC118439203 [Folsomia candida]
MSSSFAQNDEENRVDSGPAKNSKIFYPDVEVKVELDDFVMVDDMNSTLEKDPLGLCEENHTTPSSPPWTENIKTKELELWRGFHDDDAADQLDDVEEEYFVKVEESTQDDDEIMTPGSEISSVPRRLNLLKLRVVCKICAKTFSRRDHLLRHLNSKNVLRAKKRGQEINLY